MSKEDDFAVAGLLMTRVLSTVASVVSNVGAD